MWNPIKILRPDDGLKLRHVLFVAAAIYLAASASIGELGLAESVPAGVGLLVLLTPVPILYSVLKSSQDERKTLLSWSLIGGGIGLVGSQSGVVTFLGDVPLVVLEMVGGVGFLMAAVLTLALGAGYLVSEKGSGGGSNPGGKNNVEKQVLSNDEYEEFGPHPYEDEFSGALSPSVS